MPDARRRGRKWQPKGERNGNWRHGRFTCEAIAERVATRGLLRSARDTLAALGKHTIEPKLSR